MDGGVTNDGYSPNNFKINGNQEPYLRQTRPSINHCVRNLNKLLTGACFHNYATSLTSTSYHQNINHEGIWNEKGVGK